jgi:hypothetical protein
VTNTPQGAYQPDWRQQQQQRATGGHERNRPAAAGHHYADEFGVDEADPEDADVGRARFRGMVVDRMTAMSSRHGGHAWDMLRGPKPLLPHALAFLYTDGQEGQVRVAAATRLFSDDAAERDLGHLLRRMTVVARRYRGAEGFDPRGTLTTNADEMSEVARYVGLGISTLDTPMESWIEVLERAQSPVDVQGRCYILLDDRRDRVPPAPPTKLIVDRGGRASYPHVRLQSTRTLNIGGNAYRRWSWLHDSREGAHPRNVWERMAELHATVYEGVWKAEQARRPPPRHR